MDLAHVELFPAVCGLCRRSPRGELFVDTRRQLRVGPGPQRERLYVCPECGGQIAHALGYVPAGELEAAVAELESVAARVEELEAAGEDDRAVVEFLRGLIADAAPEADSGE